MARWEKSYHGHLLAYWQKRKDRNEEFYKNFVEASKLYEKQKANIRTKDSWSNELNYVNCNQNESNVIYLMIFHRCQHDLYYVGKTNVKLGARMAQHHSVITKFSFCSMLCNVTDANQWEIHVLERNVSRKQVAETENTWIKRYYRKYPIYKILNMDNVMERQFFRRKDDQSLTNRPFYLIEKMFDYFGQYYCPELTSLEIAKVRKLEVTYKKKKKRQKEVLARSAERRSNKY